MKKPNLPVSKRSLFSWVRTSSLKLQGLLVVVIAITVFARVVPLEMQKRIVNEAIFLRKIDLLLTYCGIYLVAVLAASGLKFLINTLETIIGQRALADMRKDLYHHILTLPLNFFRKTQPGLVVNALVSELSTSGNFVGMAVAAPVTNILTLLAFASYLIWLNPLLGIISLSIYPIVVFIVPMVQRGANKANKKRVDTARNMSDKITESVSGIHEVHSNAAYHIENRKFDAIVNKLLKIRIVWSLYRFGVKVLNNFFVNLSPFLIFLLGGYLAMKGQLELGALVAFLSAQEKLYTPWKELIEFYQVYEDASVRYKRVMQYFDALPEHAIEAEDRETHDLAGPLNVKDLTFVTESGIRLLDGINLDLQAGEQLALVGFSGSGKSTLALCIGQLYKYNSGHVLLNNFEVSNLSKQDMVHNMGFVSQSPFIFTGTIEDNLMYSCLAQVNGDLQLDREQLPSLDDIIEVLQQTGIFVDVLRFGLNAVLEKTQHQNLIEVLIRIRENFQRDFGEALADYVEFFNENKYLYHSNVAENLTFGTSNNNTFETERLSENTYFQSFLDEADLKRPLLELGSELSRQTVDILGNLPADEVFFKQSPIMADELDDYKILVEQLKNKKLHQLNAEEQERLLHLALRFTPGIHKMVGLPQILERLILEGRSLFREKVTIDFPDDFSFYQLTDYIYNETILNNIFFGKTKTENPQAQEKINQSIIQLLIEEDVLETIVEIGLQFQVGSKGDRLSGGQRQKLAIARSFLKKPNLLIMDEATSALDNSSQARIQRLLETRWKGHATLIAVVHRLDIIKNFDKIAVLKAGKIVELGGYEDLIAKKGMLYELVHGKK